ncbi:hypothetical protein SAMN02787142_0731 [Burkholderia sp. WP9]|uniref:hypothetical protein n=1 Tax=Burkholderia sp. WP9 TaxID=1500263 RepID=UPI000896A011|nr:hypothetical protein [Burkholderia sp. WP9]SEC02041.1 hypothetical protein SAMN02787142_0731 [Burkholderia sp. WP9]
MRHSIVCAALCSALLVVPGCGTSLPAPISPVVHTETVQAEIEVPVPCIDSVPDAPRFLPDSELLAPPNGSAVDRVWRDHLQRKQWEGQLEALLVACVGAKK